MAPTIRAMGDVVANKGRSVLSIGGDSALHPMSKDAQKTLLARAKSV